MRGAEPAEFSKSAAVGTESPHVEGIGIGIVGAKRDNNHLWVEVRRPCPKFLDLRCVRARWPRSSQRRDKSVWRGNSANRIRKLRGALWG